jgi:hypothetical protein
MRACRSPSSAKRAGTVRTVELDGRHLHHPGHVDGLGHAELVGVPVVAGETAAIDSRPPSGESTDEPPPALSSEMVGYEKRRSPSLTNFRISSR